MALNDIFGLTASWVHSSGQVAQFAQDYELTALGSDSNDAQSLRDVWYADMADLISNRQHPSWTLNHIAVRNYMDDEDFSESFPDISGLEGGGALPSFIAVGFRSPRKASGVNRGRHNLPTGSAAMLASDGSLTATARDYHYFIQQQLGLPLIDVDGATYTPVIARKTYVNGELTSVVRVVDVTGQWQIDRYFTTQKSRQGYLWEVAEEPA